jgi:hypothetical protein
LTRAEVPARKSANLVNLVETAFVAVVSARGADWLKAGALALGLSLPLMPVIGTSYVRFLFTLLVLWWVKLRGEKWADFDLIAPKKWLRYIAYGVLLTIVDVAWSNTLLPFLAKPIATLTGANPHQAEATFSMVIGNLPLFLFVLPFLWLFGAFGEEAYFRGDLMTRIEGLLGGGRPAVMGAIAVQAVIFALGHWYQGPVGMVGVFFTGLIYGVGARLWGRNLWPNMVAHGLIDTLGFTFLYLGLLKRQ